MARYYRIFPEYVVMCSECNEDISEDHPNKRREAEDERDIHEAWHKRDEA